MNNKSDSPLTLFKNPFRTEAAFTDTDRGIRIGFSRITENSRETFAQNVSPSNFIRCLSKTLEKSDREKHAFMGHFNSKFKV